MAIEFRLPELGENVSSATISKILVNVGDAVSANQIVLEVETDKAVAEIPCTIAGTVAEVRVTTGQNVKAGTVILVIAESAAAPAFKEPEPIPSPPPPKEVPPVAAPTPPPPPKPAVTVSRPASGSVLASPSVRRLARSMGVDLEQIPTADPSGRVTAQDVMAFAQSKSAPVPAPATPAPTPIAPALETGQDAYGPIALEPMNTVRRKTAEHMTLAWTTIPHVTHFDKADVTELEDVRKKFAKQIEAQGGRLTLICFVLKVLAAAFQKFPKFNASVDMEQHRIILKKYFNIGVAVDTPNGLLVPVVRNVESKSIKDLAMELPQLAEKARVRKLALEDMQGGTFTVSNLGGLGGTGFTPVLNAPEVALLAMSRSSVAPVYREGVFVPRLILPLGLSYDHRIIDGADAARFLRFVAEALEKPWVLWMEE
ncbi:MAG TPA: dihydrolipoamide acetyltransferase family protein [Candidatus Hydrogenedentes bacterium]|nr:dihydrolipoamide acetyltransferase family protein [Candidatus Hydrogenedentota bacterium]